MKKITLIFSILLLTSCTKDCQNKETTNTQDGISSYAYDGGFWNSTKYKIEEVKIDECEYIIILGVEGRSIIHKANCKNEFHIKSNE